MSAATSTTDIGAPSGAALGTGPGYTPYDAPSPAAVFFRAFAWANLALLAVFLINNFLIFWGGLPGVAPILGWSNGDAGVLGWLQALAYPLTVIAAVLLVVSNSRTTLRSDSKRISDANAYFIRGLFWGVLLLGLVDLVVSFLAVEGVLKGIVGDQLGGNLIRKEFRGPYVHVPLLLLGFVIAARTKTLGFQWLALLVVIAELAIVIGRFVFSYEQAFMADLVRLWYAALFLFASAYTLLEDGHVRVDVFYAAFRRQRQGSINYIGAILLGMPLCWLIILIGMWGKASAINAPVLVFELGQQSSGLYVKYLLAAFIGIFAISMLMQFCAALLEGVADARDEPGRRERASASVS